MKKRVLQKIMLRNGRKKVTLAEQILEFDENQSAVRIAAALLQKEQEFLDTYITTEISELPNDPKRNRRSSI
jgi:hypothetical protein